MEIKNKKFFQKNKTALIRLNKSNKNRSFLINEYLFKCNEVIRLQCLHIRYQPRKERLSFLAVFLLNQKSDIVYRPLAVYKRPDKVTKSFEMNVCHLRFLQELLSCPVEDSGILYIYGNLVFIVLIPGMFGILNRNLVQIIVILTLFHLLFQ